MNESESLTNVLEHLTKVLEAPQAQTAEPALYLLVLLVIIIAIVFWFGLRAFMQHTRQMNDVVMSHFDKWDAAEDQRVMLMQQIQGNCHKNNMDAMGQGRECLIMASNAISECKGVIGENSRALDRNTQVLERIVNSV